MKVRAEGSFPTPVRTTAQGVILSVAGFAAAAFATVKPLILSTGTAVLHGILTAAAGGGVGWAKLVFRTRDDDSDFDI